LNRNKETLTRWGRVVSRNSFEFKVIADLVLLGVDPVVKPSDGTLLSRRGYISSSDDLTRFSPDEVSGGKLLGSRNLSLDVE